MTAGDGPTRTLGGIFIGSVTANGLMASAYVNALLALVRRLDARGIGAVYRTIDGPSLDIQRDLLAREFLASDCKHLLLVDGDVVFAADLCERLLAHDRPAVGAVLARAAPDLAWIGRRRQGLTPSDALALAQDWNVRFRSGTVVVEDGLCEVASLDPGFLLIACGALDRMVAHGVPTYRFDRAPDPLHAFFRDVPEPGRPLDASGDGFCRRLSASGVGLFADVTGGAHRIHDYAYGLSFRRYVEAAQAAIAAGKSA